MYRLTGQDILYIWETSLAQSGFPVDRAITILAVALPGVSQERLAHLSIGKRDALLFAIREQTFGPQLESLVECPVCQERLEFSFSMADFGMANVVSAIDLEQPEPVQQLHQHGYAVQFRALTGADLALLAGNDDVTLARRQLVQQCVVNAYKGSEAVAIDALPETVITSLAQRIAECDPHAAIEIDLSCPACEHRWQTIFDIVSFFWTEISMQAQRLLREVHTLALAYGWREADILSMSAARRLAYLEMVT